MKVNVKSDVRGWQVEDVVDRIFKDRGIDDPEHFLNPTEDDLLPLTDLKNIEKAGRLVLAHVQSGCGICILADTDSDGCTSGAIIYRYLRHLGADPVLFINHGKAHGLQPDDLDKYKVFNLVIIVDSLDATTNNYEEIQDKTSSDVMDVIVLDHHIINPEVPYDKWVTLVSSQRDYGNPQLSGAGVCWKFCKYLDSILDDDFADTLVDLSCTGIISDMMDMSVPENRYIAYQGFNNLNNPVLKKLSGGFGFDAKCVAFSVAPVINACVRIDKNEYAMRAFIEDDNDKILSNLKVLKQCKEKQNDEINALMEDVVKQCESQLDKKMMVAFIKTELGVAGLIANKLLERYKRPIVILKEDGDRYKGSMRAIGVDDFQSMINESGLASSFGHSLAASCDIKKSNLQKFIDYMEYALPEVGSFEETIEADIWCDTKDVDREYIGYIQMLNKISGTGFPAVKVYLNGITDYEIDSMSQGKHLVIHIANSDLTLIQWNFNGDWEELEDASMFEYELECVCELQSGFIGRKFMLQGILNWLHIKEG